MNEIFIISGVMDLKNVNRRETVTFFFSSSTSRKNYEYFLSYGKFFFFLILNFIV